MQIQFTLDKEAYKPTKAHATDAGFDLYAKEDQIIGMNNVICDTGVHILIPTGFVGLVLPRSSMSAKGVISATGVIDTGYSGSIKICLRCQKWHFNSELNLDNATLRVYAGERIAQIVIVPLPTIELQEVKELPQTDRGSNGFGVLKNKKSMKQKLIHTDLLSKYKHSSVIGIATATHLEYCNFMYKAVRHEIANFEIFYKCLVDILASVITLILIPLFLLTHGLIFYPYYIYKHIKFIRDVIKKYGIEKLNIKAKELTEQVKKDHTENE